MLSITTRILVVGSQPVKNAKTKQKKQEAKMLRFFR